MTLMAIGQGFLLDTKNEEWGDRFRFAGKPVKHTHTHTVLFLGKYSKTSTFQQKTLS